MTHDPESYVVPGEYQLKLCYFKHKFKKYIFWAAWLISIVRKGLTQTYKIH